MKKSVQRLFKTILVLSLVLTFVISLADIAPVKTKAASNSFKAVYTVKQLKKAMKAKSAATIILRTETYDSITIPSVKNAKNKELVIYAQNATVKNKSKFKSIKVNYVNKYTEAASGNTIYWTDVSNDRLVVAKGKTVNSITFPYSPTLDPRYVLRKGAKIKDVNIDASYFIGTSTKKGRTITVEAQSSSDPLGDHYVSTYKYNKRGQITEVTTESAYNSNIGYNFKFDKNGNYKELSYSEPGDIVVTTTYEYDANNNLVKGYTTGNDYAYDTYLTFEYDANGNRTEYAVRYAGGEIMTGVEYTYDNKGRCIEEYNARYDNRTKYTYDAQGRLIEKIGNNKGDIIETSYIYDKNGMLISTIEKGDEGYITQLLYSYDYLGNRAYLVSQHIDEDGVIDNDSRFGYMINDYVGEYPVYEDGFWSPVNHNYNKAFLEESGFTVVTNAEELINAIRPGAGVIIAPGEYNLSDYIENLDLVKFNSSHKYVQLNKNYDGFELVIKDVDDLLISGGYEDPGDTILLIEPRYSAVFRFEDCDRLQLCSFTAGHTSRGNCKGNVIDLYACKDVGIYNVDLFGCGVYGLVIYYESGNVRVFNSCIHDCEYGIDELYELGGNVTFTNCMFYGSNAAGSWYSFDNDSDVELTFKKCSFGEEETNGLFYREDYITFIDCLWSTITRYPEWG